MTVLFCILGFLLIAGGASMMFTPLSTFLQMGQFIGIAMAVYSVTGLVQCIQKRSFRADFFLSIITLIIGIFLISDPLMQFMTDTFVLYFMAAWLLVSGITSFILSFRLKKEGFEMWWLKLISAILDIILGILCFCNPAFTIVAVAVMVGFFFIDTGINMITLGVVFRAIQ